MSYWRFIDKWGLLDKVYMPDGGDTCHREGTFWSLLGMMSDADSVLWLERFHRDEDDYLAIMKKLHVDNGVFVRHVRPLNDVNSWDRMSRDQFQPMVIAAGYWSKEELSKIIKGHRSRGFLFCTNTRKNGATRHNHGKVVAGEIRDYGWKLPDITGLEILGNFIRSKKSWFFYLALFICDIEGLFGSIKWRCFPKHNIALNHTLSLLQACHRLPTPLSWLSRKIMPFERLFDLIQDHLDDLHPSDDMQFLADMFKDAKKGVFGEKK